ncbi:hypothetical protein [Lactococcus cremoris]|uniref:hypothetical protein n=2 Tax=Lactococcus lactis subsp. cremoris TaxID=1359 RepID=UPI001962FE64|nr:hypothetical protein [Lactococcus cremoris]QRZ33238.2 hypothetical protein LLW34_2111 [Lactococcus cremoris]
MKKILRFGLGIVAGAAVAHAAYHGYKNMEEEMIHELTDRVRQHFSTKKIDAFWIFDEPTSGALFEGGIVSNDKSIAFEINAKTLEVFEKKEELL